MRVLRAAVIAAVAVGAVATALPAGASTGVLDINGRAILNPHGCYSAASPSGEAYISNHTNGSVWAFAGSNCTGGPIEVLSPGTTAVVQANSVYAY